jgi:GNAT superfamily N-acetyltransferase
MNAGLIVRRLDATDSIAELTGLLHRAYRPLADMGFRFVATHQDDATTMKRASEGECYVGVFEGKLVATITVFPPGRPGKSGWYAGAGVAGMGQFAVAPSLQRRGIGAKLMELGERRALEWGASEIAVDTAEHAHHLVGMYMARGYRLIEHVQWEVTNYRSVVLSKALTT